LALNEHFLLFYPLAILSSHLLLYASADLLGMARTVPKTEQPDHITSDRVVLRTGQACLNLVNMKMNSQSSSTDRRAATMVNVKEIRHPSYHMKVNRKLVTD
jgi:hypothetical protein